MIWHLLGMSKRPPVASIQRTRTHASRVTALQRQETALTFVKREQWTEDEVAALPSGEHDYFDRKAGALFDSADRNNLLDVLAKAGSAFANSGGG